MKRLPKFRPICFLNGFLTAAILCTITWKSVAYGRDRPEFRRILTALQDTTKPGPRIDTVLQPISSIPDTVPVRRDTSITNPRDSSIIGPRDTTKVPGIDSFRRTRVDTFTLKISKDSLDAPLVYEAEDSAVVMVQDKRIILYGKTRTTYKEVQLTAPKVELDQQTQVVTAYNSKDSTGLILENAKFKDGASEFTSDTIRYNFKTQVGLTQNTFTQDQEFNIHGEFAKKVDANTTFIKRARFTTCNLDDPHFAFISNKMKVINKKLAVSGPTHPEFEGVPVPIYLPFGFFPLSQGRHSGIIKPEFTTNEQYGLGLEGLGYYKVLSEYWDVKVYGNIYSYGGWSAHVNPTYRKRYRYNGQFNLSVQSTRSNFKGDPDFSHSKTYMVMWNHAADSRARPGTSFSASVNAGSTKYNSLIPNNPRQNFQNQLGSSITYSKSWVGKPYNLSLSANHNQNNATRLINVNLPDAAFTVNTLYPFQSKNFAGAQKWYEKLGIGYSGSFRDQISFYDSAISFSQLIDTLQWGAQHNIPITLSLPPLFGGALILAPSISYGEIWIDRKVRKSWNDATQKLDTSVTKGIFTDHSAQFSLNFSTAVFGTYQFKKSRIIAIRHVIRPQLGLNYKPDLSKNHFYRTKIDTTGYVVQFSEYESSLYNHYGQGEFGGMSFQLDNNVEMKWRSRKDTGLNAIKKIRLIDGYGLQTSYNFFADSNKLQPIRFYFRTTLFEKVSISANTTLDPYKTDRRGIDINRYVWQDGKFKFGRLTTGGISISTNFKSKPKDEKKEDERRKQAELRLNDPTLIDDQRRLLDDMQQYPEEFVDFNIPWQVNISYSLSFTNRFKPDYSGFEKDFNTNLNFSGSFNLTPKWNFSANGYYDFKTSKLQTFQMSISREMHCWQLYINVIPVGPYRSFSFSISPKSALLQDLKINRSRSFTGF